MFNIGVAIWISMFGVTTTHFEGADCEASVAIPYYIYKINDDSIALKAYHVKPLHNPYYFPMHLHNLSIY